MKVSRRVPGKNPVRPSWLPESSLSSQGLHLPTLVTLVFKSCRPPQLPCLCSHCRAPKRAPRPRGRSASSRKLPKPPNPRASSRHPPLALTTALLHYLGTHRCNQAAGIRVPSSWLSPWHPLPCLAHARSSTNAMTSYGP